MLNRDSHHFSRHAVPARLGRESKNGGCPYFSEGFTLIEMLVALAIFSLAALALLRLGGATAANSARLNDQALAQMVAKNLAVETLTDPAAPAFGATAGEAVNAGRRWRWTRNVMRSPEARIQQIEIRVEPEAGGPGRASLIVFRRAPA